MSNLEASVVYERLVHELYQALVNQDSVKNIQVLHDVKLVGKAKTPVQIDVYWEFEIAGVKYRTIIECKHFKSKVKGSVVRALKATIDDLGPGTTGIIATTVGFQPQAIAFAKEYGIRLVLVNPLLRELGLTIDFINWYYSDIHVMLADKEQRSALQKEGVNSLLTDTEINPNLLDSSGAPAQKLWDLLRDAANGVEGKHRVKPEDRWLDTVYGPLLISFIDFRATRSNFKQHDEIILEDAAKAVLEDVLENTEQYLRADGTVGPKPISAGEERPSSRP